MPVIVCNSCKDVATTQPHILTCELCKEGYVAPEEKPDLIVMKRKAESLVNGDSNFDDVNGSGNKRGHEKLKKEPRGPGPRGDQPMGEGGAVRAWGLAPISPPGPL